MTSATYNRTERLLRLAILQPKLFIVEVVAAGAFSYLSTAVVVAILLILFTLSLALALVSFSSIFLLRLGFWALSRLRLPTGMRSLLRAFATQPGIPYGVPVNPAESPALYSIVGRIRSAYGIPEIAGIHIVSSFEVEMIRQERRGLLGWRKDYLHIGLPLFYALSVEELEALVAQHLGARSSHYGRLSQGIVPVINFWIRLKSSFESTRHWGWKYLEAFHRWYLDRFPDYWGVLSILNMLDADRRAADLVGVGRVGSMLVNATVAASFLETIYWPSIAAGREGNATPPGNSIAGMQQAFRSGLDSEQAKIWLNEALAESAFAKGGVPTLSTRLTRLNADRTFSGLSETGSADYLLGDALQPIVAKLDADIQRRFSASWRTAYEKRQSAREALVDFEKRIDSGEHLSDADLVRHAELVEREHGMHAAIATYRDLLLRLPGHPKVRFALGRVLLASANAEGIEQIERAIIADASLVVEGLPLLHRFLSSERRFREADEMVERYRSAYESENERRERARRLAEEERTHLRFNDTYRYHALSESRLKRTRELIAGFPGVRVAFLIRKDVRYMPERPLYVLGIVRRRTIFGWRSEAEKIRERQILDDLAILGDFRLVMLNQRRNRPMWKIMKNIRNACIFET